MKNVVVLVCLLLWVPSGWTGLVELEQRINFKWRGLPVATMNFSASIPFVGERGVPDEAEGDASKPAVLIELMGQTKGPLRLFEDYQATVRYLQIDAQGSNNAFTLSGMDNGDPERRHIVFETNRLPEVKLFDDSTASEALAPHEAWLGNTTNPLGVLKSILLAAAKQESCKKEVWGYDGKRRYRLTLRDVSHSLAEAHSDGATELQPKVTKTAYACELTIHSDGSQSAYGRTANRSSMTSRFAALWPFNDGDRRVTFVVKVEPIAGRDGVSSLTLAEVRIFSKIGAIVGSSAP